MANRSGIFWTINVAVSNQFSGVPLIDDGDSVQYCPLELKGGDGNAVSFQEGSGYTISRREGSRKRAVVNIATTTGWTPRFQNHVRRFV